MATPYNLVSRDAQLALTEFSNEFEAAMSIADPDNLWANQYGLAYTSTAIATRFPIPLSAAGYVERKGDDRLRSLYERTLGVKPKEWVDGVQILKSILEAPDFVGWASEPTRIAREGIRQPNTLVAELLEANPLCDLYREENEGGTVLSTLHLFEAANHLVNVVEPDLGTFGNITTVSGGSINAALIKILKAKFRARKGPNGKPMGLRFDTLVVPAAREEEAKDFFESDNLILAVLNGATTVGGVPTNNRHKGTVNVVVGDELTNADKLYALDSRSGARPWIIQTSGSPEEITYDESSDFYKDTGKVAKKYVLKMGVAAALPQAIELVDLS